MMTAIEGRNMYFDLQLCFDCYFYFILWYMYHTMGMSHLKVDFNFLLSNHPTSLYEPVWQCHSSCQFCNSNKPRQDKNLYTSSLWPTPQNLLVKIFLIIYICYHLHIILFILFPTIWLSCKCSQPCHTVCKITTLHPSFLNIMPEKQFSHQRVQHPYAQPNVQLNCKIL